MLPFIVQPPLADCRSKDAAKMAAALESQDCEDSLKHSIRNTWPACAGCATELPVSIVVAKRSMARMSDDTFNAWPFCHECMALAMIDNKEGKCEILPGLPTSSFGPTSPVLFFGDPCPCSFQLLRNNFDMSAIVSPAYDDAQASTSSQDSESIVIQDD